MIDDRTRDYLKSAKAQEDLRRFIDENRKTLEPPSYLGETWGTREPINSDKVGPGTTWRFNPDGICPFVFGDKNCGVHASDIEPDADCDKTFATCRDAWRNENRYGGWPLMPHRLVREMLKKDLDDLDVSPSLPRNMGWTPGGYVVGHPRAPHLVGERGPEYFVPSSSDPKGYVVREFVPPDVKPTMLPGMTREEWNRRRDQAAEGGFFDIVSQELRDRPEPPPDEPTHEAWLLEGGVGIVWIPKGADVDLVIERETDPYLGNLFDRWRAWWEEIANE